MVFVRAAELVTRRDDRRHVLRQVDVVRGHHVIQRQQQSGAHLLGTEDQHQIRRLVRRDRGIELHPVGVLGVGGDVQVDVGVRRLVVTLQGLEERPDASFFEHPEVEGHRLLGAGRLGTPTVASTATGDHHQRDREGHCEYATPIHRATSLSRSADRLPVRPLQPHNALLPRHTRGRATADGNVPRFSSKHGDQACEPGQARARRTTKYGCVARSAPMPGCLQARPPSCTTNAYASGNTPSRRLAGDLAGEDIAGPPHPLQMTSRAPGSSAGSGARRARRAHPSAAS